MTAIWELIFMCPHIKYWRNLEFEGKSIDQKRCLPKPEIYTTFSEKQYLFRFFFLIINWFPPNHLIKRTNQHGYEACIGWSKFIRDGKREEAEAGPSVGRWMVSETAFYISIFPIESILLLKLYTYFKNCRFASILHVFKNSIHSCLIMKCKCF